MVCNMPTVSILVGPNSYSYPSDEFDLTPVHRFSTSFAFDMGGGVRYLLPFMRRNSCIMLNVDYLRANVKYSVDEVHTQWLSSNQITYGGTVSGIQKISLLTVALGIGYQFK